MTPPASSSSFAAAPHASLRAAGLLGEPVTVTLTDRGLELRGAASGEVRIEAARTERVRLGYFNGKHVRVYTARIWPADRAAPLVIEPAVHEDPAYGAVLRGFAAAVAVARGIGAVERGVSEFAAALVLALPLMITIGFNVTAYLLMGSENRPGWYALLVFSWLLSAVALWVYVKRQRPRAVASLAELEAQLPPSVSGRTPL